MVMRAITVFSLVISSMGSLNQHSGIHTMPATRVVRPEVRTLPRRLITVIGLARRYVGKG